MKRSAIRGEFRNNRETRFGDSRISLTLYPGYRYLLRSEGGADARLRSQQHLRKILRGELPCYKVYEDDKALAFLDIMPRAPGHALVLPRRRRATSSMFRRTTSPT